MIFRSIEISQFRRFRDTITVAGLDNQLNVIAGDNEEGKSTVLLAIRAAFFERYRSSVGVNYRPYGQKVSPKVKVVFELNGKTWTLEKTFSKLKDGGCFLQSNDGNRWEGPEAEDYLQQLLGFDYAKRGPTKSELQGLPGLLWVEQGHAFEPVDISDRPREQLHSVFDDEMTELLGGDRGEAVYRRVEELRSEYIDKRDNPRGDHKKLMAEVEQRESQLLEKEAALHDYDDKVDRLADWKKRLRETEQDNAIENAQAALKKAKAAYQEIELINVAITSTQGRVREKESEQKVAAIAWQGRQELVEDAESAGNKAAKASENLAALQTELAPMEKAAGGAEEKLSRLRAQRAQLQEVLETLQAAERLKIEEQHQHALEAKLAKVREAHAALQDCLAEMEQITLTPEELAEMRDLDHEIRVKDQTLKAAATRVDYDLVPGASVNQSGQPLSGQGHIEVTEATELVIDGVGKLAIQPGGSELPKLQAAIDDLSSQLNSKLSKSKLPNIADAEKALRRLAKLVQQQGQRQAVLDAEAPEGLSVLEDRLQEAQRSVARLSSQVTGVSAAPASAEETKRKIDELKSEIASLAVQAQSQREHLEQLREKIIECRTRCGSLRESASALAGELESDRKTDPDNDIATRLAEANSATKTAIGELTGFKAKLAALNPDAAEAEIERTKRALGQLQEEDTDLQRDVRDLEVELNALGQRGLAEELSEAQVQLDDLKRELGHKAARAVALDLLYRTMTVALVNAKAAVAIPVIEKMRPYLQQLLPGTEASVDQDLMLTGLNRDGNAEQFENLSIGTREQLAIIVRLAYADLLNENGIPVTVILDDALVNSDDGRRDRMKAILFQAARKYQIIMLTCHARDYRDTGGKFIVLSEC